MENAVMGVCDNYFEAEGAFAKLLENRLFRGEIPIGPAKDTAIGRQAALPPLHAAKFLTVQCAFLHV